MANGEDFAVVIGISRYPNLRDLQGPVRDAEAFRAWLQGPAGVPPANVQFVASHDPPAPGDQPIQDEIDDAFNAVLGAARQRRVRRLYVYFAGHGCAQELQHVALLVANASHQNLNRSLDAASYEEDMARMALFPEQVIFYDCCRNFDLRVRGRRAPWSDEPPNPNAVNVTQLVFYAAGFTQYANERAMELYDERRGLFTRALLEGLNGGAAMKRDDSWVVTSNTLVPYVYSRLEQLTAAEGVLQQPQIAHSGVHRTLDLCTVERPGLHPMNVSVAQPGVLVVRDAAFKELRRQAVAPPGTELRLPAADYIVQLEAGGAAAEPRTTIALVRPGAPVTVAL